MTLKLLGGNRVHASRWLSTVLLVPDMKTRYFSLNNSDWRHQAKNHQRQFGGIDPQALWLQFDCSSKAADCFISQRKYYQLFTLDELLHFLVMNYEGIEIKVTVLAANKALLGVILFAWAEKPIGNYAGLVYVTFRSKRMRRLTVVQSNGSLTVRFMLLQNSSLLCNSNDRERHMPFRNTENKLWVTVWLIASGCFLMCFFLRFCLPFNYITF